MTSKKKTSKKKNEIKKVDAIDLEIVKVESGFALSRDGEMLLTEEAKPIQHTAAPLLQHMVSEFDGHGKVKIHSGKIVAPKFFGSYALYSVQKKYIEPRQDELSLDFANRLLHDLVLHPVAGPEQVDQYACWHSLDRWLGEEKMTHVRAHAQMCRYDKESLDENSAEQRERMRTIEELRSQYVALAAEKRAVVMFLHAIHQGPVLYPLALVQGKCTTAEYAQGVMAGHAILAGVFGDVTDADERKAFQGLSKDAQIGLDYIHFYAELGLVCSP